MSETYTIRKADDGLWEAVTDSHPELRGVGRTEYLAIDHLKKLIQDLQPVAWGLYETTNSGARVSLRGVCMDESFAQAWVDENDRQVTWESRHYRKVPLLGPT